MFGQPMKNPILFALLLLPIFACSEEGEEAVEDRSLSCNPELAAAEIFRDAPGIIPRAYREATCDLWKNKTRACSVSGETETCCSKVGTHGNECCTNDSGNGTYTCVTRIREPVRPGGPGPA